MEQIHPVAAIALANCIPAKELNALKDKIAEGSNTGFDLTAKLTGRLTRAEATTAAPTASILNEAIFAETIRRLGVTKQAFEKHLFEVATEALVAGIPIRDHLIDKQPELLTVMHVVKKDVIAKLPDQERPGAIKVIADVQLPRCRIA